VRGEHEFVACASLLLFPFVLALDELGACESKALPFPDIPFLNRAGRRFPDHQQQIFYTEQPHLAPNITSSIANPLHSH
jgi:hypothetical protein